MKENIGKLTVKWAITAVFAAIILSILGWLYTAVLDSSVVMAGVLATVLIAVLLLVSMKVNPGVESFMHLLPTVLIVSALVSVLAYIWENSPLTFIVEWSLPGIGLALSAVIFASALTTKVMKII